ncbi:MAG: alpha/beta hydrolase [Actinomycetota bacterium]
MNERSAPVLILVHGAWHGSWCWAGVEPRLRQIGVEVRSVELTSQGDDPARIGNLYSDTEVVRGAASSVAGPVVLLGHSYGGMVITQAAQSLDNVWQLIYLSAFVPDAGQSLTGIVEPWVAAGADLSWLQPTPEGLLTVAPGRVSEIFYNDCDPTVASEAEGRLRPQSGISFQQPFQGSPRPSPPSLYVVCTEDRAISAAGQRQMAQGAQRVLELSAGHCPFLSQPERLAQLLTEEMLPVDQANRP